MNFVWNAVNTKMPENGDYSVIVAFDVGSGSGMLIVRAEDWLDDGYGGLGVTHWANLPPHPLKHEVCVAEASGAKNCKMLELHSTSGRQITIVADKITGIVEVRGHCVISTFADSIENGWCVKEDYETVKKMLEYCLENNLEN